MDEFKVFNPSQTDFSGVPIDKVEQYWNERPCNIRHSLAPIGSKEYFDQVEERKYRVEPHIPGFAMFDRWNGKRVLEIGCGLGTESINFARAGAILTVVDLSLESLNMCKKRFEVYGLQATFVHANAEQLASVLGDTHYGVYDLIWSFGVVHHTPHPPKAIDSIRSLLKVGGELRMMVYSKISYKLFFLMRETGHWDFSKVDSILSTFSEAQTGYVTV
jgi:2-polyprenyl-3-methyl-5-hydroxy-6-metoxy-1,4-benzoquinol methylase